MSNDIDVSGLRAAASNDAAAPKPRDSNSFAISWMVRPSGNVTGRR